MREKFRSLSDSLDRLSEKVFQYDKWAPHIPEGTEVRGRERFNLPAAYYYGRVMIPALTVGITAATATAWGGEGVVKLLPQILLWGVGGGAALSTLFGIEKRRSLSNKINELPVS